jgi:hypothetical protein
MSSLSKTDKLFIYALVVAIMTALFFCQIVAQISSISIGHLHGMMYVIEPIVPYS